MELIFLKKFKKKILVNENREYVKAYSMGMKQKLALIYILSKEVDVYVLDEPFVSLDTESKKQLKKLLIQYRNDGKAIIVVTHNMKDVYDYCDHVYLLHEGVITENTLLDYNHHKVVFEFDTPESTLIASKELDIECIILEEKLVLSISTKNINDIIRKLAYHNLQYVYRLYEDIHGKGASNVD